MRRSIAFILFIVLCLLTIDLTLLRVAFVERTAVHRERTVFPDRGIWWPDYPRFLEAVRERTQRGDAVAIVVPARRWDDGYSYAYYRASYFLAGREVLPVITPTNDVVGENLDRAKYVAVWGKVKVQSSQPVVWRGFGGVLLRRR